MFRTCEIVNQDTVFESLDVYGNTIIPVFDLAFIFDLFIPLGHDIKWKTVL